MRMQAGGFLMLFLLFLLQGLLFSTLERHSGAFQVSSTVGCGSAACFVSQLACSLSTKAGMPPPLPASHPSPAKRLPPQLLYYLSSFFAQLGPNCTTFLTAGEVRPATQPPGQMRLIELGCRDTPAARLQACLGSLRSCMCAPCATQPHDMH